MGLSGIVKQLSIVAALAWLASWFLPVLSEVPGWMAFRFALSPLVPYKDAGTESWEDAVPMVMSALTNGVFVAMFALLWLGRVARTGLFIRVAVACFILNLYWLVQWMRDGSAHELLIGYYVWLLAFALLVVSGVLVHRTSKIPTAGTPS